MERNRPNAWRRWLAVQMHGLVLVFACLLGACASGPPAPTSASPPPVRSTPDLLMFEQGDPARPAPSAPRAALLLVGGGQWPREAFRWWFEQAGHGHVVILRASYGGEHGDEMYRQIGGIASARTIVFRSRKGAFDPQVATWLAGADAIFVSGGDQSNYLRYWRDTPVQAALNRHLAAGKPLGGTSAGLAILGRYVYGALDGNSLASDEILRHADTPQATIAEDFLRAEPLYSAGVITDTHFAKRHRQGRLIGMMARIAQAHPGAPVLGLAVDEDAVMGIDAAGTGRVWSDVGDRAWLFRPGTAAIRPGQPLDARGWKITGMDPSSLLHTGSGWRVDRPAYVGQADVVDGTIHYTPAWPAGQGGAR